MPLRTMYQWKCTAPGCEKPLTASCELNERPPHKQCDCGMLYSSTEIIGLEIQGLATATAYADGSPQQDDSLKPKNQRISRPLSKTKLQRYKALERAEQDRIRRMDHEEDDDD